MKLHLFNKKPSETKLRKKIAKQFSANSKEYKIRMLEIDKQFNKISDEDFEYALLEINYHPDSTDYKLYKLDLDKKYNKISEYDYASNKLDLTMNHDTNEYKIVKLFAFLCATGTSTILNFIGQKFWVFKEVHTRT